MVIASINLHIVFLCRMFNFIQIRKGKSKEDEIRGGIRTGFNSKLAESGAQTIERNKGEVISASLDTSGAARGGGTRASTSCSNLCEQRLAMLQLPFY